jgi:hypothetical protein
MEVAVNLNAVLDAILLVLALDKCKSGCRCAICSLNRL